MVEAGEHLRSVGVVQFVRAQGRAALLGEGGHPSRVGRVGDPGERPQHLVQRQRLITRDHEVLIQPAGREPYPPSRGQHELDAVLGAGHARGQPAVVLPEQGVQHARREVRLGGVPTAPRSRGGVVAALDGGGGHSTTQGERARKASIARFTAFSSGPTARTMPR